MKLQYNLKTLNVTELVTQMQSIIQIKIFTSKITDLGGGGPFQKHCDSVCRAGGKPSTWFPPGTRRADNFSGGLFKYFLLMTLFKFRIAVTLEFPDFF